MLLLRVELYVACVADVYYACSKTASLLDASCGPPESVIPTHKIKAKTQ